MSDNISPNYTFLPWLRKGIGTKITDEENNGAAGGTNERASIDVQLKITAGSSDEIFKEKEVHIMGPGDIVGISPTAVVKNDPLDKMADFEPNYLASIDFYDEDFAWRYSPAKANANGQLRPWVFLVVLKEAEFTLEDPTQEILPSFKLGGDGAISSFLPNFDELTAWAHVQVNDNLAPDAGDGLSDVINNLSNRIASNPDLAICRIISPRKLEPNESYQAFLVPTYETGRLAGLGFDASVLSTIPAQASAWGTAHGPDHEPNRWPFYYTWSFETGNAGDFESLVRALKPRALDSQVGRRPMDLQNAGYGLNYSTDLEIDGDIVTKTTLSLEGALKTPGTEGEAYPYSENPGVDFRKRLQDLVNLDEDLKVNPNLSETTNFYGEDVPDAKIGGTSVSDDPIVSAPLYGRWYALKNKVSITDTSATDGTASWLHELNLDPRNRVVAAIGTEVIQEQQEFFMDQAWEQIGDVIEANKKLNNAQLAKEISNALYKKHISSLPPEKALALTGKMKRRIKNSDTGKTYFQEMKESQLPLASEDRSMRRIMRPVGPVMKRADSEQKVNASIDNFVEKLDNSILKAARDKIISPEAQKTTLTTLNAGIISGLSVGLAESTFKLAELEQNDTAADNAEAVEFHDAINNFGGYFTSVNWETPVPKPIFDTTKATQIKEKAKPTQTIVSRVYKSVIKDGGHVSIPDRIVPAMAHPVFRQPMYEAIRDLDSQLLIPNLNLVPMNTISLLETNQKFIESYMVGLNHEMGRELLWREYPTDQRGTYFRQFWNISDAVNVEGLTDDALENNRYDIPKIHDWSGHSKLGEHNNRIEEAKVVLLIRGDVLKKYPNAVIYAVEAEWQMEAGLPQYDQPRHPKTDGEVFPIFNAKIEPDITFLGFDMTISQAKGANPEDKLTEVADAIAGGGTAADVPIGDPGYFFVIKERPGEVRFALDVDPEDGSPFTSWNDLHWGRLSSTETIGLGELIGAPADPITWGAGMNAAEMATILYQNPVMVCVHAREMLSELG